MNSRALKDKVKSIAKENGIDPQALMQNFFQERILCRIANSEFKDKIILKGGLLVALIIGKLYAKENEPVDFQQVRKL